MQANAFAKTLDMDQQEWLNTRRNGIGGSDASAIVGLNPWKGKAEVYLDKMGLVAQQEENERMYWGNVLEDVVAKEFTNASGFKVKKCNFILQHSEHPFILANVDRLLVGRKEGLECKTTSEYQKDEWAEDKVPDHYILQCQHYMAVTGYQAWWIAALIGGNHFVYKKIDRDEEIIDYLLKAETQFWNEHIEKEIMPDLDGSPSSSEALKIMYPESELGSEIQLPDEAEGLLQRREFLKSELKHLQEQIDEAENKIKAMLGKNEIGHISEYKVSWKTIKTSRVDTKKLKIEQPAICQQYQNTTSYRKFDVKQEKGGR